MRVYLTQPELKTDEGQQLLKWSQRALSDGKLDLQQILQLRKWLQAHKDSKVVNAIPFLHEIMERITEDKKIDADELQELQLALEQVIPTAHRTPVVQARKKIDAAKRERQRQQQELEKQKEKQKEKEEKQRQRAEERARFREGLQFRLDPIRHILTYVAGVSYSNEDGSSRQAVLKACSPGERLVLRQEPDNPHSKVATAICRLNGQQLGYALEDTAERIVEEGEDNFDVAAYLKYVEPFRHRSSGKTILGARVIVFFLAQRVTPKEFAAYGAKVIDGDD